MNYEYFIRMIKQHQTDRIRAYVGPQQANPEHVPSAFALLMHDIISILDINFSDICKLESSLDQGMVIFGLQPAGAMIASNLPLEKKRFIEGLEPDYHFCCTLDFFKVPVEQINALKIWHCTDSIVIDFTSGELMDSDRFISKVYHLPVQGKSYGYINEKALDITWTIVKFKQVKAGGRGFQFDNFVMEPTMAEVA